MAKVEKRKAEQIVRSCFPELVDKHGEVRFPIDDLLLRKLPEPLGVAEPPKSKIFNTRA